MFRFREGAVDTRVDWLTVCLIVEWVFKIEGWWLMKHPSLKDHYRLIGRKIPCILRNCISGCNNQLGWLSCILLCKAKVKPKQINAIILIYHLPTTSVDVEEVRQL